MKIDLILREKKSKIIWVISALPREISLWLTAPSGMSPFTVSSAFLISLSTA